MSEERSPQLFTAKLTDTPIPGVARGCNATLAPLPVHSVDCHKWTMKTKYARGRQNPPANRKAPIHKVGMGNLDTSMQQAHKSIAKIDRTGDYKYPGRHAGSTESRHHETNRAIPFPELTSGISEMPSHRFLSKRARVRTVFSIMRGDLRN